MKQIGEILHENLKKYFGFDSFKGNQEEIISNVLEGHDSLVIMPTGGGKSLCYQLPALLAERGATLVISPLIALMKDQVDSLPTGGGKSLCYQLPALIKDGTAIVISPLIALMKNQVDAMRSFSLDDGVAHFLNSSLTKNAIAKVKKDVLDLRTRLLYVAPESLTKEENIEFLKQVNISFYAIDEAHCISE